MSGEQPTYYYSEEWDRLEEQAEPGGSGEIVGRLLTAAVAAGDVRGLAAAIGNVLALTADPFRVIDGRQVHEAVELGLSGSPDVVVRMSGPIEE